MNWYFVIVSIALLVLSFSLDSLTFAESLPFDTLLLGVTTFGSILIILYVIPSVLLWKRSKHHIPVLWVALVVAMFVAYLLKFFFARERPFHDEFILGFEDYSFPSAHTAAAFVPLPILAKTLSRSWLWVSYAIVVGFSRIHFGHHYFSDVIGGALLGHAIGYFFIKQRKVFSWLTLK